MAGKIGSNTFSVPLLGRKKAKGSTILHLQKTNYRNQWLTRIIRQFQNNTINGEMDEARKNEETNVTKSKPTEGS